MFKVIALLAFVSAASAVQTAGNYHVGLQGEQTIRGVGFGGLGTVSHQTKAVDSAFSSVRKYDTRVSNPAVAAVAAPVAYAQPAYAAASVDYAQPAYAAAPVAYAQPAVAKVAAPVAYAQPAYAAAPVAYAQPAVAKVAAPVAYASPAVAKVAAPASLLGVAYSAVPQVAHLTFDGFGVHYGY